MKWPCVTGSDLITGCPLDLACWVLCPFCDSQQPTCPQVVQTRRLKVDPQPSHRSARGSVVVPSKCGQEGAPALIGRQSQGEAQQAVPQTTYPLLQANPQEVPLQVAVALAGGAGQGVHDVPQVAIEVLETHCPEQTCRDPSQLAAWHCVPEQLKLSPPSGQGAQVPAQRRWLALQVIPQLRPSQFATLFGIAGQGVHEAPQVAGAMLETQEPAQT